MKILYIVYSLIVHSPHVCGVWGWSLVIQVLVESADFSSVCEIMLICYAIKLFQMFEVVPAHTLNNMISSQTTIK